MSVDWTLAGVDVPWILGDAAEELAALRRSATLVSLPHVSLVALTGAGATAWAGRLVSGGDQLRPGEGRHGLLLDDDGVVLADVWLVARRDGIWLIGDGLSAEALLAVCAQDAPAEVGVALLSPGRAAWTLDGPFAWEVMARYDSPGVIGLPPLTWYLTDDDTLVLRTGRTGEYGYLLLIPDDAEQAVVAALETAGEPVELRRAGAAVLAQAALENFAFWPHAEGRWGLTPLELQLQWRLTSDSPARGVAAVRERRLSGAWRRRVSLVHGPILRETVPVTDDDRVIGQILRAEPWQHGPGDVGLALLDLDHAHPGFSWRTPTGPATTLSAPLITNRSLFVRPQRHAWVDQATLPAMIPRSLGEPVG